MLNPSIFGSPFFSVNNYFYSFTHLDQYLSVFQEKDDLEARINDINVKAEQASTQQAATQKELERTRQQANEALRSMDAERQQLRTANNK